MKTLLLCLLAIGLAGACGASRFLPPPPGCDRLYTVGSEFSNNEREELQTAVNRWNAIATATFCLQDGDTEDGHIRRIPYKGAEWQQISARFHGSNVLGMYSASSDDIVIVDGLTSDQFEEVALHELGHAHGLAHVAPPGIMTSYIGTATDFTPNDLAECLEIGVCRGASGAEVAVLTEDLLSEEQ